MKKLTSIFLALACVFAIFTLPALPADTKGNDIPFAAFEGVRETKEE